MPQSNIGSERTAILFVHGILGTPKHFEMFLPFVPSDWTVSNITLAGHGGSVKDFSNASMAEWKNQVHSEVCDLSSNHDKVIIAAHSMGALFAIREAVENHICSLFLLNLPLKIHITPALFSMARKVYTGKIKQNDKRGLAAAAMYGLERDRNIFHYIGWIPRYLELFKEIRKTRKIIDRLSVDCTVYLSERDEMVSHKTEKYIKNNPSITVKHLAESGHFYYSEKDKQQMQADFCDMVACGMRKVRQR